jgi:hypothetical protein
MLQPQESVAAAGLSNAKSIAFGRVAPRLLRLQHQATLSRLTKFCGSFLFPWSFHNDRFGFDINPFSLGNLIKEERLYIDPLSFDRPATVSQLIGYLFSRLYVVLPVIFQHLIDLRFQILLFDRKTALNPPEKVSRHPISACEVKHGFAGVFEAKDSAMFQKTPNQTADDDIFTHPRNLSPQTADSSN